MRASVIVAFAASAAVLPSMSMPIRLVGGCSPTDMLTSCRRCDCSSESYGLYEREVPAEGSGALGFGLIKDVFKVGKHLIQ